MSNLLTEKMHNPDELVQYRSLSTLAVIALLLGLSSALAFLGPLALAVPLATIGVALLALARITAANDSLTGRPLALAGLALAVVFAAAAMTRVYVRDNLSIRQADDIARRWLTLVSAGSIDDALEVMTPDALVQLQPPPPTRDAPRPPFDRAKAVALLQEDPLPQALQPAGEAVVTFQLSDEQFFWTQRDPQVGCTFRAAGGQAERVEGSVVLTRKLNPQGEVAWLVDSWKLTKPEPHSGL